MLLHANSEDSDQTGRTYHFVGLSCCSAFIKVSLVHAEVFCLIIFFIKIFIIYGTIYYTNKNEILGSS